MYGIDLYISEKQLERIRESGQTVLGLVPYDIFMLFLPYQNNTDVKYDGRKFQ